MAEYRLYFSSYCYFCHKVLAVLNNRRHSIELANTSEDNNRRDLITGGGRGQVPCLRIREASGELRWLYESEEIIDYIQHHRLAA